MKYENHTYIFSVAYYDLFVLIIKLNSENMLWHNT